MIDRVALALLVVTTALPAGAADEPVFLNTAPDVSYVGREACGECHVEKAASYAQTGMGRSFYPMSPDRVVEDFETENELVLAESGLRYRMDERDGRFFQRQFMVDSHGREIAVEERELLFVIGSNNHSRSYVTAVGDKLFQTPVCWYPDAEKWELCPGYEERNMHFAREISQSCLYCHNGVMELKQGTRNAYRQPYPHGIGCERCHGPGELHVERWRGQEKPTATQDPTIVNVRRLPQPQRAQVCFQCHLGEAGVSERVRRHDRELTSLRPGQPITDVMVPFRLAETSRHSFGLTSQADRMLLSRCYTESGGQLECLDCHNPHVSVYREDRPPDLFRRACLRCHDKGDCTDGSADDCVSCHMRKAEPEDQRFTETTDHWIRRDPFTGEDDRRESLELVPIFPKQLAGFDRGERAYYEARASLLLGSRTLAAGSRSQLYTQALESFEQAIDRGFRTADAWFFLGKARQELGRIEAAEDAYSRAVALEPSHHDAGFALGQARAGRGELEPALEIFNRLLERNPDDPMALAEAGRVLGLLDRHAEAIDLLDRAVEREPWNPLLHLNRGRLFARQGKFARAAAIAERVVALDPDDSEGWLFYVKAHEAAGRKRQAAEGRRILGRLQPSPR